MWRDVFRWIFPQSAIKVYCKGSVCKTHNNCCAQMEEGEEGKLERRAKIKTPGKTAGKATNRFDKSASYEESLDKGKSDTQSDSDEVSGNSDAQSDDEEKYAAIMIYPLKPVRANVSQKVTIELHKDPKVRDVLVCTGRVPRNWEKDSRLIICYELSQIGHEDKKSTPGAYRRLEGGPFFRLESEEPGPSLAGKLVTCYIEFLAPPPTIADTGQGRVGLSATAYHNGSCVGATASPLPLFWYKKRYVVARGVTVTHVGYETARTQLMFAYHKKLPSRTTFTAHCLLLPKQLQEGDKVNLTFDRRNKEVVFVEKI